MYLHPPGTSFERLQKEKNAYTGGQERLCTNKGPLTQNPPKFLPKKRFYNCRKGFLVGHRVQLGAAWSVLCSFQVSYNTTISALQWSEALYLFHTMPLAGNFSSPLQHSGRDCARRKHAI